MIHDLGNFNGDYPGGCHGEDDESMSDEEWLGAIIAKIGSAISNLDNEEACDLELCFAHTMLTEYLKERGLEMVKPEDL